MTERERSAIQGRALLLYDGVCALCNGVVRLLLRHDRADRLRYAALQSDVGQETLARLGDASFPDGVVLLTDALTAEERVYRRSDAVAQALQLLGGGWRVREFAYGLVARVRYRLFGRYPSCPLPPPEQRGRLLGVVEP